MLVWRIKIGSGPEITTLLWVFRQEEGLNGASWNDEIYSWKQTN